MDELSETVSRLLDEAVSDHQQGSIKSVHALVAQIIAYERATAAATLESALAAAQADKMEAIGQYGLMLQERNAVMARLGTAMELLTRNHLAHLGQKVPDVVEALRFEANGVRAHSGYDPGAASDKLADDIMAFLFGPRPVPLEAPPAASGPTPDQVLEQIREIRSTPIPIPPSKRYRCEGCGEWLEASDGERGYHTRMGTSASGSGWDVPIKCGPVTKANHAPVAPDPSPALQAYYQQVAEEEFPPATPCSRCAKLQEALEKAPECAVVLVNDFMSGHPDAPVTPQGMAYGIEKLLRALAKDALSAHDAAGEGR